MRKRIKKSQILTFGSFLVFVGVVLVSSNYLIKIRNDVFNEMIIKMMDANVKEEIEEVPEVENIIEEKPVENNNVTTNNLSASGSKNFPKSVTKLCFLAYFPSNKSVNAPATASTKIIALASDK